MSEKSFKIIVPADIVKSEDGEWIVQGVASTPSRDRQGEVILQTGIDTTPIDEGRAYFNWDHQVGPENVLGPIDSYQKDDGKLVVKGRLFKNHSKAKAVHEIMSSLGKADRGRMGMSVEGKILERAGADGRIIKRCQINAVALTMSPVNQDSYADLVKSMTETSSEFDISTKNPEVQPETASEPSFTMTEVMQFVQKALSVGSGYADKAPTALSGGEALAQEDLDKKPKKLEKCSKCDSSMDLCKCSMKPMTKALYKSTMVEILSKLHELYPDYSRSAIWEAVKDRIHTRFPELK